MNWIALAWELAVNCMEAFLFFYLITHRLNIDANKKNYAKFGILLQIILISFFNILNVDAAIALIFLLVYSVIFTILLFKNNNSEKILWGSSYTVVALIADSITFRIASVFTTYQLGDILMTGEIRFIMSLVYLLTCMAFVFLLAHGRKTNLLLSLRFRIILLLLISLGVIATQQLLDLIIYTSLNHTNSYYISQLESIICIVLFILFGFIIFIEYLGVVSQQNEKLRERTALYELEREHYNAIGTTISALRDWKHDYKIHLEVMLDLLQTENHGKLKEFISQLNQHIFETTHLVSTNNQILDALLSVKILEAQKFGIKISHEIYLTETLPFDSIIFASLTGNLLNNAIEACKEIPDGEEKYITFSIKPFQEMLYIRVENSTTNHYSYHPDGTLKSTKKNPNHGIGLERIQDITSEANGFCHIYPEATKFSVNIMVPTPVSVKGDLHEN